MPKQLTIATYNLQFSKNQDQLIKNIIEMTKLGVNIFSFQEVLKENQREFLIDRIVKTLGNNWQAKAHIGANNQLKDIGTAIIWNSKAVNLIKSNKILLPKSKKLAIHEKVFTWLAGGVTTTFDRRSINAIFQFGKHKFRLTNIHLDHNGGINNRKKQLQFLINFLEKENFIHDIVCGDFNSFDLLKTGQESLMHQQIFKNNYVDASKDSGWTGDIYNTEFSKRGFLLELFIKIFKIHIRRKIDYIWVKNFKVIDCQKLIKSGSDHNPLVVKIEFSEI